MKTWTGGVGLALYALFLAPLVAAAEQKVPGHSYFSPTRYLEYLAGDLPLVITVPHGGRLAPSSLPKRTKGVSDMDANTQELARALADELRVRTGGGHAHVIFSLLHRSRLDPNREIREAAEGHPAAEQAWREFHAAIAGALAAAVARHGFAFLIDLHGHAHPIARLELGYAIEARQLNGTDEELDASGVIAASTVQDLQAKHPGSAAALLRGPQSLGARLVAAGLRAVPSPAEPGPGRNPYFSGGYIVRVHAGAAGTTKVDGVQIECPRAGVRDTPENRARFGRATAEALLLFLRDHYGFARAAKP
jgi:N-formylglutamate amidohydrolase